MAAELTDKPAAHRFYKVGSKDELLPDTSAAWSCVRDDLTWECFFRYDIYNLTCCRVMHAPDI